MIKILTSLDIQNTNLVGDSKAIEKARKFRFEFKFRIHKLYSQLNRKKYIVAALKSQNKISEKWFEKLLEKLC